MHIGELGFAAGLPAQTIRFYERKGLLPAPGRGTNGYRVYDASILPRLQFIRGGQGAGLTLAEIATILELRAKVPPHALTSQNCSQPNCSTSKPANASLLPWN